MKISSKIKDKLYDAIYEEIMQLRIELYKKRHDAEFDFKIMVVVGKIWEKQKAALGLKEDGSLHEAKPKVSKLTDEEWIKTLKDNKAYEGIDIDKLHGRLIAWCELKGKQPTRARLLNWLNREERPMTGKAQAKPKSSAGIAMEVLKKMEAASNAKTGDSAVINISGTCISDAKTVGK